MASHDTERQLREAFEHSLGRKFSDEEWEEMVRSAAKAGRKDRSDAGTGAWIGRQMWWFFPSTIFLIVALPELIPRFSQQLVQFAAEHVFHAWGASVSLLGSVAWAWILANCVPKNRMRDRVRDLSREGWTFLLCLAFLFAVASPHLIAFATGQRAWLLGDGREFLASLAVAIAGGVICFAVVRVSDIKFSREEWTWYRMKSDQWDQLSDSMMQTFSSYWWLLLPLIPALAMLVLSTLFLCLYYFLPVAMQIGLKGWYASTFYAFWLLVFLMVIFALVKSPSGRKP
jgi:hypothetical protein